MEKNLSEELPDGFDDYGAPVPTQDAELDPTTVRKVVKPSSLLLSLVKRAAPTPPPCSNFFDFKI